MKSRLSGRRRTTSDRPRATAVDQPLLEYSEPCFGEFTPAGSCPALRSHPKRPSLDGRASRPSFPSPASGLLPRPTRFGTLRHATQRESGRRQLTCGFRRRVLAVERVLRTDCGTPECGGRTWTPVSRAGERVNTVRSERLRHPPACPANSRALRAALRQVSANSRCPSSSQRVARRSRISKSAGRCIASRYMSNSSLRLTSDSR